MKKESKKNIILLISLSIVLFIVIFILNKDKNSNFNSVGTMISKANDNRVNVKQIPAKLRWE